MPLLVALIQRREPDRPKSYGENANVLVAEHFPVQDAPDPLRQSDFTNEGRPWGRARIQVATFTNIASFHSISEMGFERAIRLLAPPPLPHIPVGAQNSWNERTNVVRRKPTSYGTWLAQAGAGPQ